MIPGWLGNLVAWSLQVALLTAAAGCVLALLRIEAPLIRYVWWRSVLALCLLLPVLQPWRMPDAVRSLDFSQPPEVSALSSPAVRAGSPATPGRVPAAGIEWAGILGIALVSGIAARLAWLAAGVVRLRRLRQAGERASPCAGHDELANLIEAGAEIRYVPVLGQPLTFGLTRPVVLLPDSIRRLPDHVQRAVLAHELWHVRRRDWGWILAEEGVRAVLWFHPAIWFLVSRVQAAREEVVDELTVMLTNSRRGYLEALLAFADEPPYFAAAAFARRRHLFRRMMLVSREAVMTSRNLVASGAVMVFVLVSTCWAAVTTFPLVSSAQQMPPRDVRPGQARPATNREAELQKAIDAAPQASVTLYFDLSRLQEDRGAIAEAEATWHAARQAFPGHHELTRQLVDFYQRQGQFDKAVAVVEDLAAADPSNPAAHLRVAQFYFEKVQRDQRLSPSDRTLFIDAGLSAVDRALTYKADFAEALVYKSLLLRAKANQETDIGLRAAMLAEADALRARAMELNLANKTRMVMGATAVNTPLSVDGQAPVRIGGNIKPPAKVKDVRPVYPDLAQQARVQGVVIIEAVIDGSGRVREASVLRSIPLLDEAALDAVRQWEFMPTHLNGAPVPVIMTVTVNFTLQ